MSRLHIAPLVVALTASLMLPAMSARADEATEITRLAKAGQADKALDRANSYLASHPKDIQVRFVKGLILTDQNKAPEAIKVFTSITEDYPELPEAYNNLAVLYASQGQFDKAKTALEMAINTHPSYATAHENLGDIYAKMASQAYDKALSLDKNNTDARTKLALIKEIFSKNAGGGRRPAKPEVAKVKATTIAAVPAAPVTAPAPAAVPAVQAPATPAKPVAVTPAVAKPAAPAAPAPAPAVAKADEGAAVLEAVNDWAKAWSAKDVGAYLNAYASDFQTPGGESRSAWERSRKERITKPKPIQVTVSSPQVTVIDATHAKVTFQQSYRSANLNSDGKKTLVMTKVGDKWLIQQEKVGH